AEGAHGHAQAASRQGFYAWLDRGYAFTLRLSMRHRWAVVGISLATIAATWPIYGWVKQEYTHTDVDEREVPGVRHVLIPGGGSFLGRISQGNMYVRTAPHDDRTFGLARLWRETLKGDPLAAFRGNYSQREVMQQVRQRVRKF